MTARALDLVRAAAEPQSRSETDPVQALRTKFWQAGLVTANAFRIDGSTISQAMRQDIDPSIQSYPFPLRIKFPEIHAQFTLYDSGVVAVTLMENMVGRSSIRRRSVTDTAKFFVQAINASEKLRHAVVDATKAVTVAEKEAAAELATLRLGPIQAQRTFSTLMGQVQHQAMQQQRQQYRND